MHLESTVQECVNPYAVRCIAFTLDIELTSFAKAVINSNSIYKVADSTYDGLILVFNEKMFVGFNAKRHIIAHVPCMSW